VAKRAVHITVDAELGQLLEQYYRRRVDHANRAVRAVPTFSETCNDLFRRCEPCLRKVVEAEEAKA